MAASWSSATRASHECCAASQSPWQEIQRGLVDQLCDGMVLRPAVAYQRIVEQGVPRDNH
jgi:dihydroxy-acid dehydratase